MVGGRGSMTYASLQRGETAGSALDQHWAQAVVMSPDLVVVPDAPDAEDRELIGTHLLVRDSHEAGSGRRIAIRHLEILSLAGRPVCVVGTLAESLEVADPPRSSDPSRLVEALATQGSLWSALAGLVPDGSGQGSDPGRFLDGLDAGLPDVVIRRPPRRIELPDAESVGKSICWWVPWCEPDGRL